MTDADAALARIASLEEALRRIIAIAHGPEGWEFAPMTDTDSPAVDDATFMENVREALENGHDRCCAHCGVGTSWDDMDIHDRGCPGYVPWSLEPSREAEGREDDDE